MQHPWSPRPWALLQVRLENPPPIWAVPQAQPPLPALNPCLACFNCRHLTLLGRGKRNTGEAGQVSPEWAPFTLTEGVTCSLRGPHVCACSSRARRELAAEAGPPGKDRQRDRGCSEAELRLREGCGRARRERLDQPQ